jgi:hypothetical protein
MNATALDSKPEEAVAVQAAGTLGLGAVEFVALAAQHAVRAFPPSALALADEVTE